MVEDMAPEFPADQEISQKYVRFLLEHNLQDSPDSRKQFCDAESVHPKLLYHSPHIRAINSLFSRTSNMERLADMSLREWMYYHHHYVHQAYRYGLPALQQKWLGHDILKSPFDCWIYQELIYSQRPDFIIELGVMFGGASHFYASICDMVGHGSIIGIDISLDKVRSIDNPRIQYIEGSSTSPEVFDKVRERVRDKKVLVVADSDHEKNHVLAELRLYSRLVTIGSYYVVEDSLNDVMNWHPVPNEGPQAAVRAFIAENDSFVPDVRYAERYILSLNPLGYLLRVK
jgi:cephalosporin hydroxylase